MADSGGFGLQWQITVSAALTTVVNVREFDFPEVESEMADITAHDSSGGYNEFIPSGRFLSSEFDVLVTWDRGQATHAQIETDFLAGSVNAMKVIGPTAAAEDYEFSAYIMKMKPESPQDGSYDMRITVRPTGAVTPGAVS